MAVLAQDILKMFEGLCFSGFGLVHPVVVLGFQRSCAIAH